MERTFTEEDLTLARDEAEKLLIDKLGSQGEREEELGLEGALVSVIVLQIILPIIVSLTSKALYDILKGKKSESLSKDEIEEIIRRLNGSRLNTDAHINEECFEELRSQLIPLGFSEKEILDLVDRIRNRLAERDAATDRSKPIGE